MIRGNASVTCDAKITDKVTIGHNAYIQSSNDYLPLRDIGNASVAFRDVDNGITVVHKGTAYSVAAFREACDEPRAVDNIYAHFKDLANKEFEDGLASISTINMSGQELV